MAHILINLMASLSILTGLAGIFAPKVLWYWKAPYRPKGKEPTESSYLIIRLQGVLCIIAGIVFLYGSYALL